jgi:hypothetical protein
MKKICLLILAGTAFMSNCRKIDVAKGTPACLKSNIRDFEKNSSCGDSHVDKYSFDSATVYVFDPGTCGADMTSAVYDENCRHLGDLGGLTGNTKINGKDFSTATFVQTIWKK